MLLANGGFTRSMTVRGHGKLAISWVASHAGKKVTIGSLRASFRRRGKYQTRFVLSRQGRSLLHSTHTLHFLVDSWISFRPSPPVGCAYIATVESSGEIAMDPRYCNPPSKRDPF